MEQRINNDIKSTLDLFDNMDPEIRYVFANMDPEISYGFKYAIDYLKRAEKSTGLEPTLLNRLNKIVKNEVEIGKWAEKTEKNLFELYKDINKDNNAEYNIYETHAENIENIRKLCEIPEIVGSEKIDIFRVQLWFEYFVDLGMGNIKDQVKSVFTDLFGYEKGFIINGKMESKGSAGSVSTKNPNILNIYLTQGCDTRYIIQVMAHELVHVFQDTNRAAVINYNEYNKVAKPKELEAEFLGIVATYVTLMRYHREALDAYLEYLKGQVRKNEKDFEHEEAVIKSYLMGQKAAIKLIKAYSSSGSETITKLIRGIYSDKNSNLLGTIKSLSNEEETKLPLKLYNKYLRTD